MRTQKIHAFILKKTPYKESDFILQLFTLEKGLLSCLVKGVRKNNKWKSDFELFTLIEAEYIIPKDKNSLRKIISIEDSSPIEKDFGYNELLSISVISEICLKNCPEHHPIERIFNLLYYTRLSLNADNKRFLIIFLVKFFSIIGLFPEFKHCGVCNQQISSNVLWNKQIICSKCNNVQEENLDFTEVKVLYFFQMNDFQNCLKVKMDQELKNKLFNKVCKEFLHHTEKSIKTLDLHNDDFM